MSLLAGFSVAPPGELVLAAGSQSGDLGQEEAYKYVATYVTIFGETLPTDAAEIVTTTSGSVIVTLPELPENKNISGIKLYRTEGDAVELKLLAELAPGVAEYLDTAADEELGAEGPPELGSASPAFYLHGPLKSLRGLAVDYEVDITATPAGDQTTSYLLTKPLSVISTCATADDSVRLPFVTPEMDGVTFVVSNQGAEDAKVFAAGAQTISGNATASIPAGTQVSFLAIEDGWVVY